MNTAHNIADLGSREHVEEMAESWAVSVIDDVIRNGEVGALYTFEDDSELFIGERDVVIS